MADVGQRFRFGRGRCRLFLQHLKVVGHDQDVVDVVALAGVIKDSNDVREVGLLVAVEEVLPQVKGLEDEADVLLVLPADGNEGIEADADLRACGIDDAQVVQPSGGGNQGQQLVVEELALPLAVDDDERDLVTVVLWSGLADQVLLDDVQQQGGFAGAGHAEAVGLHDPHFVRPEHRLLVDVVADDDGVVGERLL